MSDPAVCSFLSKVLCARGGRLQYEEVAQHVGLPDKQLRQILEEAGRFLLLRGQGGSAWVLPVSAVRVCVRQECAGCEHLHLCKLNLRGRCKARACKYSHEVFSESNRKVLKDHELSGLNEDELRVLLLQNDPFLLPDVCSFYNKGDGNCAQKENCSRLHICRYFLRGLCRFPRCKRSHDLLQPKALELLLAEGVDDKLAWNIQTICEHKTAALSKELGPQKHNATYRRAAASGERGKLGAANQREDKHEPLSNQPGLVDLRPDIECSVHPKPAAAGDGEESSAASWKEYRHEPSSDKPPLRPDQGVKVALSTKPSQNAEKKKNDEICLYYVWRFCKNKNNCDMIHYDVPYRWQKYTGIEWKDFDNMEEIEKAYCDPNITSFPTLNINFGTMLAYISPVRRLSTPSSVTKPPKFVMTTKWLWYWKNDQGQWIEYGKPDGQRQGSNLSSDDLENVFLADPNGSIRFTAGFQQYEINFKDMIQRNLYYRTQREMRRRPKFVSSADVKYKKGHADHAPTSTPELNCPKEWDKSALPEIGYKAIELSKTSPEYVKIENLFLKTMRNYVIHKIKRIQNPSLWQVFQWQKEQMKKKKGGKTIDERLLFHGTSSSTLTAICNDNFDWRICGTNGTIFGKGSYFARDAQYSHNYCQRDAKEKTMFVAQVLVGDFITGNAAYTRPPPKSADILNCYDSCVDNLVDPSIFVIFEKHQIYPAYMIDYSEEEKKCILS